ncbi:phosphatase 2A regulatory B subunit-domain-containing protein [Globomyces pollinis-pini]|nr:phosphatase 2A regulatory B subunit-domain-containing protein [Globomyces pollinis-pini]
MRGGTKESVDVIKSNTDESFKSKQMVSTPSKRIIVSKTPKTAKANRDRRDTDAAKYKDYKITEEFQSGKVVDVEDSKPKTNIKFNKEFTKTNRKPNYNTEPNIMEKIGGFTSDTNSYSTIKSSTPSITSSSCSSSEIQLKVYSNMNYSRDHLTATSNKSVDELDMNSLPNLSDIPHSERQAVFLRKVEICRRKFDFTTTTNLKAKQIKFNILNELLKYIAIDKYIINDQTISDLLIMISENIFRTLPHGPIQEEDVVFESEWLLMQVVYEICFQMIISQEFTINLAKKYINELFIIRIFDNFNSPDLRERDYIKNILHRLYAKVSTMRQLIRQMMDNTVLTYSCEFEEHNGISEILEIYCSMIDGFTYPVRPEHKKLIQKILIPLLKTEHYQQFYLKLHDCMMQFIKKDPASNPLIISSLLHYWPKQSSLKQVLFLGQLEELLVVIQKSEFEKIYISVFNQIEKCIRDLHFQVSERALAIWHNDHINDLIKYRLDEIAPIIIPSLYFNLKYHWHRKFQRDLTYNALKRFLDMDLGLLEQILHDKSKYIRLIVH